MSNQAMLSHGSSSGRGLLALLILLPVISGCAAETGDTAEPMPGPALEVAEAVEAVPSPAARVARGEYLVTIAGCHDCHTPLVMGPEGPQPDMTRMLSGHPQEVVVGPAPAIPADAGIWLWAPHNTVFASQLGTAYAINLTPDENTGIGVWTEEIFIQTLRSGRHWGVARPILPPMPWVHYATMPDEDLQAIWAYLRSLPPISNRVPEAVVAPMPAAATP
jgi:hypothetical protein